jgi:hypothetical protein
LQWTDCEFAGRDFRDFNNADLSRLRTERVVFSECDFSGVNLAESEHRASAFRNRAFQRTSLWHWGHRPLARDVFRQRSMLGSVFVQCRLRPLTFDEVTSRWRCSAATTFAKGDQLGGWMAPICAARPSTRRCGEPPRWLARLDVPQALAYALAHGLRLDA